MPTSQPTDPASHKGAQICRGCWDQMHVPIPIRGPLALPFRMFGVTRSKMNPNICTICERSFRYVKKQRHVTATATILFADIRGFTALSEHIEPVRLSEIVSLFHDRCAQAIWAHDGIVNKQMGDGLMAIFNFPILRRDHAAAAVMAALDIQQHCTAAFESLDIGEFSSFRSDFTAIGGAVNLASRLESQAGAGEIVMSPESAAQAAHLTSAAHVRALSLKGIELPVQASVLVRS